MSKKEQMLLVPQDGECVVSKFLDKDVRKTFYNGEWWFAVPDAVNTLIDTEGRDVKDGTAYWRQLKKRLKDEGADEVVTNCHELKFEAKDGKMRDVDCANIEGLLRIIQSIPSKNAEPFKKWLAKVGFERLQEQNNPDLTVRRAMLYYQLQGRDKQWIQNRIDGQFTRNELTGEWKQRDVKEGQECATLTNIISQETFGISISDHKTIKGFQQNKKAARDGGGSAGEARKAYENKIGIKVVTSDNFVINAPKEVLALEGNEQEFTEAMKKTQKQKK